MEIKKNKNVDLEQGRFRMYMISLIVVLSALFVALEYNSGDNEDDVEDYDELTEEMELAPLKREEDRIALAIKQQPKPAADKIKVVEKIKELNRMDMPEEKKDGKPVSTYVPFRNGLFLAAAASIALSRDCSCIYYGAHRQYHFQTQHIRSVRNNGSPLSGHDSGKSL